MCSEEQQLNLCEDSLHEKDPPTTPQVSAILAIDTCTANCLTRHSLVTRSITHGGECSTLNCVPELDSQKHPFVQMPDGALAECNPNSCCFA